jgi:hypothetical protein
MEMVHLLEEMQLRSGRYFGVKGTVKNIIIIWLLGSALSTNVFRLFILHYHNYNAPRACDDHPAEC